MFLNSGVLNMIESSAIRPEYLESNGLIATFLATLTGLLGLMPLAILPLFVGILVDELGLSAQMAGALTSVNLLGNAIGVLAISFITRLSVKHAVYLGVVLAIIFELASFQAVGGVGLFLFRFMAGVGGGLVTGAAYSWIARQVNPDRGFALLILLQFLVSSILFYLLPEIIIQHGVATFYILFIISALVSLVCCFILDQSPNPLADNETSLEHSNEISLPSPDKVTISKVLISIALFELAASGIWAFIERMGIAWQLTIDEIGMSLSVGSLAGIPGSALVIIFCLRWGRLKPISVGFISVIASLLLFLVGTQSLWLYTVGLIIFNGAWSYVIPYIQGIQAQVDETGRVAIWGMFTVLTAIAAGPFVFALFIGEQGFYSAIIFASALLLLSFYFIFTIAKRLDSQVIQHST